MTIVSINFAIFLAILFILYFSAEKIYTKAQWPILLVGSYVFYLSYNLKYGLFLIFSTFFTWLFAKLINQEDRKLENQVSSIADITKDAKKNLRQQTETGKLRLISVCLTCNLGLLIFLKYTNFAIGLFDIAPLDWLILPLGISFYTFQSIAYTIDVYRGTIEPEKNFFKYALYVSFFPQLCQGPIGRYSVLAPQLYANHTFDYDRFVMGLERCLLGFFKKLVIANNLGILVNKVYDSPSDFSGLLLTIATFMYGIQLYADFSGYMDIMLGIGQILGINLDENFNTPYFSKTITEFWRRWHISLGNWFKDYLYYPILRTKFFTDLSKNLSKKGKKQSARILPTVLGLAVTWFLIGLWHGASWNFMLYGLYHGSFIIFSVALVSLSEWSKKKLKVKEESWFWKSFQILRTYIIVNLGYVLFRAADLQIAASIYSRMFSPDSWYFNFYTLKNELLSAGTDLSFWIPMIAALIILLAIELLEEFKEPFIVFLHKRSIFVRWCIVYFLLLWVLSFIDNAVDAASNFLYFRF